MSDRPSFAVRLWPLLAAVFVVALDQFTKALIIAAVPVGTIAWTWGNDFFWLVHQRNTGVAFSMGDGLPEVVRHGLFIVVPLAVLGFLAVYSWHDKTLTLDRKSTRLNSSH